MWSDLFIIHTKSSPAQHALGRAIIDSLEPCGYFVWQYKDWRWSTPRREWHEDSGDEIDLERYAAGEWEVFRHTSEPRTDFLVLESLFERTRLFVVLNPEDEPTAGMRAEADLLCDKLGHFIRREVLPARFLRCSQEPGPAQRTFQKLPFVETLQIAGELDGKDVVALSAAVAFHLLEQWLTWKSAVADSFDEDWRDRELARADELYRALYGAAMTPAGQAGNWLAKLDALVAAQRRPRFRCAWRIPPFGRDRVEALSTSPARALTAQLVQKRVRRPRSFKEEYESAGRAARLINITTDEVAWERVAVGWGASKLLLSPSGEKLALAIGPRLSVLDTEFGHTIMDRPLAGTCQSVSWLDDQIVAAICHAWENDQQKVVVDVFGPAGDPGWTSWLPDPFDNLGGCACSPSGLLAVESGYGKRIDIYSISFPDRTVRPLMSVTSRPNGNHNMLALSPDASVLFHIRDRSHPAIVAWSLPTGEEIGSAGYPYGKNCLEYRTVGGYLAVRLSEGRERGEVTEVRLYHAERSGIRYLGAVPARDIDAMDLYVTDAGACVVVDRDGCLTCLQLKE